MSVLFCTCCFLLFIPSLSIVPFSSPLILSLLYPYFPPSPSFPTLPLLSLVYLFLLSSSHSLIPSYSILPVPFPPSSPLSMDVYNTELLEYIRPDTILSWTRARLSNPLASTGSEWAEIFSMYHSGTCKYWVYVLMCYDDLYLRYSQCTTVAHVSTCVRAVLMHDDLKL